MTYNDIVLLRNDCKMGIEVHVNGFLGIQEVTGPDGEPFMEDSELNEIGREAAIEIFGRFQRRLKKKQSLMMNCKKHGLKLLLKESENLFGDPVFWFECEHLISPCESPMADCPDMAKSKYFDMINESAALCSTVHFPAASRPLKNNLHHVTILYHVEVLPNI